MCENVRQNVQKCTSKCAKMYVSGVVHVSRCGYGRLGCFRAFHGGRVTGVLGLSAGAGGHNLQTAAGIPRTARNAKVQTPRPRIVGLHNSSARPAGVPGHRFFRPGFASCARDSCRSLQVIWPPASSVDAPDYKLYRPSIASWARSSCLSLQDFWPPASVGVSDHKLYRPSIAS